MIMAWVDAEPETVAEFLVKSSQSVRLSQNSRCGLSQSVRLS